MVASGAGHVYSTSQELVHYVDCKIIVPSMHATTIPCHYPINGFGYILAQQHWWSVPTSLHVVLYNYSPS